MIDKSEEENPGLQPATNADPIEAEDRIPSGVDLRPNANRQRSGKSRGKNRSIETRFQKGKSGNPKGRPKKVPPALDTSLEDLLQQIDNEQTFIVVDGKRRRVTKAEAQFLQLYNDSMKGDLRAAKLFNDMAVKYFGPEAEGPSGTRFEIMPDEIFENPEAYKKSLEARDSNTLGNTKAKEDRAGSPPRQPKLVQQAFSTGYLFRKVAREEVVVQVNGGKTKMLRWHAYIRQIHSMALESNIGAAKLLDQLRKAFPGKALPGDPIIFLISATDAKL